MVAGTRLNHGNVIVVLYLTEGGITILGAGMADAAVAGESSSSVAYPRVNYGDRLCTKSTYVLYIVRWDIACLAVTSFALNQ